MRIKVLLAASLLLCSLYAWARPSKSTIVKKQFKSEILGIEKNYAVYLPAGYADSGHDYPVLYLLHGAGQNYTSWLENGNMQEVTDRVLAEGMALPMIIVMPDAKGYDEKDRGDLMGYFNRPGWNYEDFFFKEFVPFIENAYRIRAQKNSRAIAGLSLGGLGSFSYALHHPDMFSSCCSLSGLLSDLRENHIQRTPELYRQSIIENDPYTIISKATEAELASFRTVRWYIDVGDDDDGLAPKNMDMFTLMMEKKIPRQYRMRGGSHTWDYWTTALPYVLTYVSIGFAQQ